MGGSITIKIPNQVGVSALTTVIAQQRLHPSVAIQVENSDPRQIRLINGFPTTQWSVKSAGLIAFTLQYLKNPSTSTPSASFELTTWDATYEIETINTGLIVISTTGKITMNSYVFSESRVLEYNQFTFDMVLKNALQPGCTIVVQFPTEFTMNDVPAGSCRLIGMSGLDSGATCTINNNKFIILSPFGTQASAGNDRTKFTIANNYIQNPTSTRPTTSVVNIKTLTQDGNSIDDWAANTKFTATENALSSITVTPSSLVTGDFLVTYTFTLRTPYKVEANAKIYVKFPMGSTYIYDTSVASDKCFALSTLSQSLMQCSASATELTITKAFPSGVCACTGEISFSVGGIINPRSFMPSQTFQIAIIASDNYLIYAKRTGITVTMNQANQQTTVTASLLNGVNGALDSYIFTVKNHNLKEDGDYIIMYAPPEVTITNKTACGARYNVRGFKGCIFERPNKMKISFIFAGRRALGSVAIKSSFEFMLTNILNPPSMAPTSQFQIKTYTIDDFNISNILVGPTVSTRKGSNMTQVLIKPSIYSDGKWTNLTFSIIPNNYMQFMSMTIQVPPDVLIAAATPNICQVVSSYSISSQMICDYMSSTRTIRILNAFSVLTKPQFDSSSILLKQLQFMIGQFINPVGVLKSGDFLITTYDKGGYIIDSQNASISYKCSPNCGSCSSDDYTKCTSCLSNTEYKYLYLGQCVQSCPTGTIVSFNRCLICPDGCQNCSYQNDSCLACNQGLFILEGTCTTNCPVGYELQLPNLCIKIIVPVFEFTSYFQKTDSYQCFTFPFSAASILVSIILWIATCCSSYCIEREKRIHKENNSKPINELAMAPLRLIEICIFMISLIEVCGWGFFLYCMINVQEKLPFYVICGAIGFNFLLNFIMTCGIMRSKENYDNHVQKYQKTYSCTYNLIKIFTLFISHKGFYLSFARYYRHRRRTSFFDFSYFDAGDEDGVSGVCFKFFFLTSVFLLHGAVIAACVLNYLSNELSKKLFCLDLDIIGMTAYQALLVLLTLLQCGRDNASVIPEEGEEDELIKNQQPSGGLTSKRTIKVMKKDKNGRMIEVEKVVEEDLRKSGKRKGYEDDPDYSRNADKTIDPMEYEEEEGGRGSQRRRKRGQELDDGFGFSGNNRRKRGDEEYDQEIPTGRRRNKQVRQSYGKEDYDPEDDSFDEEGNPSPRTKKMRQKRSQQRKKKIRREQGIDTIDDEDYDQEEEELDEDGEPTGRMIKKSKKKKQKKKKKKIVKKVLKNGKTVEEEITVTDDEDEEEEDELDEDGEPTGNKIPKKKKKKQKKKKKVVKKVLKNGKIVEEEIEETVEDDDEEEEEEEEIELDKNGKPTGRKLKKKPKKKKKKKVKKVLKNGKVIEEEVTDEEDEEEDEEISELDEEGNPTGKKLPKKKKKGTKKKKKVVKKVIKNGKVVEEEVEETVEEEDDEEEEEEVIEDELDDQGKPTGKKITTKKKKPKKPKKKKQVVKKVVKNGKIVEEIVEETEEDDEDEEEDVIEEIPELDQNGQPTGKIIKQVTKKPKPKKRKGPVGFERVSQNASSGGGYDEEDNIFGDQKAPHFQKVNVDQQMKKFDQSLIADADEPSYRELVDQINHVTNDNDQLIDRSRSPKKGNYIQLNQDSQSKEEMANNLRVSAKYGVIHQSIPTQFDEMMIDQDAQQIYLDGSQQPEFDRLQNINNNLSQHELSKHDSQFSKVNFRESQTHLQNQNGSQSIPNLQGVQSKNNLSPNKGGLQLPSEAQFEIMKTKEGFKTPTMSLENHAPEELRTLSQNNGGATPSGQLSTNGIFNKQQRNNRNHQLDGNHEDTGDVEEEMKDRVNKDDIKPKTKILFSDKSESSVEDLMEDTPSNYNVMNGRLEEDSKGLRSIMYKAISKKILYQKTQQKQGNATSENEDQEARHISSKGTDRKISQQQNPPSTSSSAKQQRREQAKMFIKQTENTGLIVNEGNTLLHQQFILSQGINQQIQGLNQEDSNYDVNMA